MSQQELKHNNAEIEKFAKNEAAKVDVVPKHKLNKHQLKQKRKLGECSST